MWLEDNDKVKLSGQETRKGLGCSGALNGRKDLGELVPNQRQRNTHPINATQTNRNITRQLSQITNV